MLPSLSPFLERVEETVFKVRIKVQYRPKGR